MSFLIDRWVVIAQLIKITLNAIIMTEHVRQMACNLDIIQNSGNLLPSHRYLIQRLLIQELKMHKDGPLASMALFRQSRLSVQRVSKAEWEFILALEKQEPAA